MRIDEKTLQTIFRTEGLGIGVSEAYLQEDISDSVCAQVYPQDVVDAVRYIRKCSLVEEGRRILESSPDMRLLRYNLELQSQASEQGRSVPKLELQLVKSGEPPSVHGQLVYHWDNIDHYFAYFKLKEPPRNSSPPLEARLPVGQVV